ncbi:MAG: RUS1 family protein [bacterium]|nr:RUS1 family protein [bacterium]
MKILGNLDTIIEFMMSPIGIPVTLMVLGMLGLIIFFRKFGEWRLDREAKKWEKEFFPDDE